MSVPRIKSFIASVYDQNGIAIVCETGSVSFQAYDSATPCMLSDREICFELVLGRELKSAA